LILIETKNHPFGNKVVLLNINKGIGKRLQKCVTSLLSLTTQSLELHRDEILCPDFTTPKLIARE